MEGSNYKFPTGDQACSPECDQMENFFFNKNVLTECIFVYFNYSFQLYEWQQGQRAQRAEATTGLLVELQQGVEKCIISSVNCISSSKMEKLQ